MSVLLTVEELSSYLHKSVSSIRSDVTRNPQSLPPICRLPGTKRLLWRREDVEFWLADHVMVSAAGNAAGALIVANTKPGRPTKAEQVKRQKLRSSQRNGPIEA